MPTENKQWNLDEGSAEIDTDTLYLQVIQAAAKIRSCVHWALNYRPRLAHLAVHAKRRRARKKNTRRIIREYLREV